MRHRNLRAFSLCPWLLAGGLWCCFLGPRQRHPRSMFSAARDRVKLRTALAATLTEDPYSVLGLPPGTSDVNAVKTAFRRLAKEFHPDVPVTGDPSKFLALQLAVKQIMTRDGTGINEWEVDTLESLFDGPVEQSYAGIPESVGATPLRWKVPSSAAGTVKVSEFERTRTDRVDVPACVARRRTDLRKTPPVERLSGRASEATLRRVTEILAESLGQPLGAIQASTGLNELGFWLEGFGSVGLQTVADAVLEMEEAFNVELLSIVANTWMTFKAPSEVFRVLDLATFVEMKSGGQGPSENMQGFSKRSKMPITPKRPATSENAAEAAEPYVPKSDSLDGRVDVKACAARRQPGLRKTPILQSMTHTASPGTLQRVQESLARNLAIPDEQIQASAPLLTLGFVFEGRGNVGSQQVADVLLQLEEEVGVELLTILAGTWMTLRSPFELQTVQDLADLVESKVNA